MYVLYGITYSKKAKKKRNIIFMNEKSFTHKCGYSILSKQFLLGCFFRIHEVIKTNKSGYDNHKHLKGSWAVFLL